ncbi:helix-turn-helix domain-containing protein [Bdellovibrio sp. HCB274]|uniref:helix-turn-helix domain-containing protein n=1 Tax=Bdellovibrio sp. HCB274 TaxID=3394361 RepID=UPI0039B40407
MSRVHQILKAALEQRQSVNPKYSLRSFAKDLSVNPSFVSRILNGKQTIPSARLEEIIQTLHMNEASSRNLKIELVRDYMKELGLKETELLKQELWESVPEEVI